MNSFVLLLFFRIFAPMNINKLIFTLLMMPTTMMAWHSVKMPNIKSLQVITNNDFEALPIIKLKSGEHMHISFDELSHNYHRFIYRLEPCNPDWTPNTELFESEWLEGINDLPIDNYDNSINTTTLYTHYGFSFPNSQINVRLSGNYRLYIIDEDIDEVAAIVELRVVEPLMSVSLGVTTNTDIDLNESHQQVTMNVAFNGILVTQPDNQIQTYVLQNGREDNAKINVRPTYTTSKGMKWEHNLHFIFDAGNEYHKFEVLDPTHPTMGLASVSWDENTRSWHAFPFPCEQRRNYLYDEDVNGAFLLRNSDNYEAELTSEYVYVHYRLNNARHYDNAHVVVNGRWTTEQPEDYMMTYNEEDQSYNTCILQKLGYYNYQYLLVDMDGTTHTLPEEGSFFQTENTYQGFVYYKGPGERCWRLLGCSQ